MKKWCIIFLWPLAVFAQHPSKQIISVPSQVWLLTEVMYHDVVNPPAAARFYAYAVLTGYEILCRLDKELPAFQQKFKNYPVVKFGHAEAVDPYLAATYGILETGKQIIPSGHLLQEKQASLIDESKRGGLTDQVIDSTIAFANRVANMIVQYSRMDGYFSLSTKQRYKPGNDPDSWRPTPPEYMAAVEPHWLTIRTFFLDSAQQFKPASPTPYTEDTAGAFFKLSKEVCQAVDQLTDEQKLIANFWDCNPFAVQFQGHMSIGLKKISPGGHWMGITGIVASQTDLSFAKSLLLHTLVACTLHDAFVSCWDEKYRSRRLRPETAINRLINPRWKPFLQTPPFPEYVSGHSVISTAAAEVLTHFLGDNLGFSDSTETYIGIAPRRFSSFRVAAAEARISRLYGGIHFMDAIESGGEQGRKVGEFIIGRLRLGSLR